MTDIEDISDNLNLKLNQVKAMLLAIIGTDTIEDMHGNEKDYYLSVILDLIKESIEATNKFSQVNKIS